MRTVRKFSTPLADCQSATQQAASLRYPRPRLPPTVSTGRAVVSNSEIGMRGLQVVAAGILPLLRSSESIAPPGLVLVTRQPTAHAVGYSLPLLRSLEQKERAANFCGSTAFG